jgi:hypothetical protein
MLKKLWNINTKFHPTQWSRVPLKKLTATQLVKKFPIFFWNPKVHYSDDKASNGPYPEQDKSSSHPISGRTILILSPHLHLLPPPSGHVPSGFQIKLLCAAHILSSLIKNVNFRLTFLLRRGSNQKLVEDMERSFILGLTYGARFFQ